MSIQSTKWLEWEIIAFEGKVITHERMDGKRLSSTLHDLKTAKIALDFSKTQYIDSSSITLILNFKKSLLPKGGEMVIFGVNEDIKELFTIVSLYDYFTIFETRTQFEEYARAKA
jgi:anti-anti-sigma factor